MSDLKDRLKIGTLYRAMGKSALARYGAFASQLLWIPVFARMFSPEQFGTLAAVQTFVTFFALLSEFGLGPALINEDSLEPEDRDGIFGLSALIATVLSLGFLALSSPIANFYSEIDRVIEIIPYCAAALFFSTINVLPRAQLLRDQAFFKIGGASILGELVASLTSIGLAFVIDPLHALASRVALRPMADFALTWWFTKTTEFGRASLGRKLKAVRPLLAFSLYQFGFNFINYFSRNLDNLLVGKFMGAHAIGLYQRAYALMLLPLTMSTHAIGPAIQPVLRKYKNSPNEIEVAMVKIVRLLGFVGCGIALGFYFLGDLVVDIVLGDQWTGVVPIIRILALSIPVQAMLSSTGGFLQALDKPALLFKHGVFSAIVMISAIGFGLTYNDLTVLSWLLVGAFHLNFFVIFGSLYVLIFDASPRRFILAVLPWIAIAGLLIFFELR